MRRHRWTIPLLCVAVALSGAVGLPASAKPVPEAAATTTRITLITGDRIQVTQYAGHPPAIVFEPDRHSSSDSAITTLSGGHTYVVPTAAAADVTSGKLDRTLFDVTTLIAEQRDDAHSSTMPVIVHYAGSEATATARAKQATIPGAARSRTLDSIGARAAAITKSEATLFWKNPQVERVTLDRKVKVSLDQSVPQIGAPAAWQRGLTGKGAKIAILDTGIDATHPDVAGRIAASQNFTPTEDAGDHYGHGTHVASIAAGNGAASGGKYKGVAPEATLLSGKVLDDNGSGEFSGIIAGMEWATAQGADVVNLSLGSREPSDGTDDLSQAVNRLSRDTGTLFVVAAGNCFAPQPSTVTSPAAADDALAVGNLLRDGSVSDRSCRGPRSGDGALKPEISAPGTDIVAARAAGTSLGEPVDDHYTKLSGTSMATPHVAGTAALLAQAHPDWSFSQLRERLISTADPQPNNTVDEQGAGRVDADQATDTGVTVDSGELELGRLSWPYPADDEVSRVLTYRNPTSTAVSLQLTAGPATVKLSTDHLTVPANGEATVTVTANRAAAGPGTFSGRISATAEGADPIVTTYGWYAEPELYNLTIKGITRTGAPGDGQVAISRLDGDPVNIPGGVIMQNGTATARLAPGKYEASVMFFSEATDTELEHFDLAVGPEANLTKDATVTLDARRGKPVDLEVKGQSGLTARERGAVYTRFNTDGIPTGGNSVSTTGAPRVFTATPVGKPATGTSEFATASRLEVPPYRITAGKDQYAVLDYYFGPRFTGVKDLQVSQDLQDVRGKLAIIKFKDEDWNGVLVKAAQDAGAAAALLYNPDVAGDNGVGAYWATGEGEAATIPAMRTSRETVRRLLEYQGTVRITGQAATPYVYDLAIPWRNQVPANPAVVAQPNQFARVDEVFGSHAEGMPTSETRYATTPAGFTFGGWLAPTFSTPARRTSYILGNDQIRWSSTLVLNNGGDQLMGASSTERVYRAGQHTSARWVAPVQNAGLPVAATPLAGVQRLDGGLSVVISPYRHGPDEIGDIDFGTTAMTVERNGVVVASEPASALWADVPADSADYKITMDTTREHEFWQYSTRVQSEWTYRSQGGEDEVMPLVLADLDVPAADPLSRVPSGKPTEVRLGLRHQAGSQSARFKTVHLELSYDGQQWTRLPLRQTGSAQYTTTVSAKQSPSFRVTAVDAKGNKLVQEITKAYGLK